MKRDELIRLCRKGKSTFRNINLQGQSFRGEDLSGLKIIDSKIKGCDFQGATLIGSKFTRSSFGISFGQHMTMLISGSNSIEEIPFNILDSILSLFFLVPYLLASKIFYVTLLYLVIRNLSVLASSTYHILNLMWFLAIFSLLTLDVRNAYITYRSNRKRSICNNFEGANLSDSKFDTMILNNCSFRNSNLSNSSIQKSKIFDSDFSGADLRGISLRKSQSFNCNFPIDKTIINLLSGLNGRKSNYKDADLSGFDLSGADFMGADLSNTKLISTNLSRANFENANMEKCDARNADFSNANLYNASLFAADLSLAKFENSNLKSANLTASLVMGASFTGNTDFTGSCISSWRISNTKINNVRCRYIYLDYFYEDKSYSNRVPGEEDTFLKMGEFESNIVYSYQVMSLIFQYGISYFGLDGKVIGATREKLVQLPEKIKEIEDELKILGDGLRNDKLDEISSRLQELMESLENIKVSVFKNPENITMQIINSMFNVDSSVAKNQQGPKFDLQGAKFAGGFAETVEGNQIGGTQQN